MLPIPEPLLVIYAIAVGFMCVLISGKLYVVAILIPVPGILLAMMGLGLGSFLMGVGLFFAAVVAAALELSWKKFAALAVVLLGVVGVSQYRESSSAVAEAEALRAEFPAVSLEERLAFHERHPSPGGEEAAARYRATMNDETYSSRGWKLKRLHSEHYLDFVAAVGFGPSRMPRVYRGSLELPVLARTPVAEKDLCFDNRELPGRPKPAENDLLNVHRGGLEEFFDKERMGYVGSVDRVYGFEPHAVATVPAAINAEHETWRVARLELVSLLKHDTPVAYVSDNLPNLEELDEVPTRPLDEFEREHLATLEQGEEVAVIDEPTAIRMLGAVRAGETCLGCHSVKQGTLLGAFSYEIRPVLHEAGTPKPDKL